MGNEYGPVKGYGWKKSERTCSRLGPSVYGTARVCMVRPSIAWGGEVYVLIYSAVCVETETVFSTVPWFDRGVTEG